LLRSCSINFGVAEKFNNGKKSEMNFQKLVWGIFIALGIALCLGSSLFMEKPAFPEHPSTVGRPKTVKDLVVGQTYECKRTIVYNQGTMERKYALLQLVVGTPPQSITGKLPEEWYYLGKFSPGDDIPAPDSLVQWRLSTNGQLALVLYR
jgi:hypothetical protein